MKELQPEPHASRRLAAFHEAGHSVAAFFRPRAGSTTRVTVRSSDLGADDAGAHYSECAPFTPATPSAARETARALAVVALAGPEVDRKLTGNTLTCGGEDYEAVRDLLFRAFFDAEIDAFVAAVNPEEVRARGLEEIADQEAASIEDELKRLVEELRHEAQALVESHWPHIEAVAEALLERGSLDGGEVRQLIEGADHRGPSA